MPLLKYDGSAAALTAAPLLSLSSVAGVTTLTGSLANESFWASAGERLVGGAGDDTYYLQSLGTSVVEQAGQGIDKIVAWSNVWLGKSANVENLTVGGDGLYAAGNDLDNIVEGQDGGQQIYGGKGQDVLVGGAGADVFIVVKGEGNDVIQDFNVAEDKLRLTAGFATVDQVKAAMTQVGTDVKIDLGSGSGLILRDTTVASFQASNFQLQFDTSKLGALTFGDDFTGPLSLWDAESNPTGKWRPDYGYQGSQGVGSYTLVSNDEKQLYVSPYYRDHNGDFAINPFSTGDGTLTITAAPATNAELFGYGYTSGLISTQPTFAQTYGYFEMRADLPDAAGAWPAFWLIPQDGSWPPELDVMETLTSDSHGDWTTWHSANGGHSSKGILSFIPDTTDGFHTYGVLWTATELVWYTDGVETFRQATPSDMNKPMFMIANLALGGWGGAIDGAALPAQLKIDYIHAYGLAGGAAVPAPVAPVAPTGGADVTLTSSGWGATLTGGGGNDTLIASSQGNEILTGGAGADTFKFTAVPWSPSHIKDFTVGTDKLDLSAVLAGYTGSDPIADGWMYLMDDGAGGTKVCVDTDGRASGNLWPLYVTNLDGVSINGLTAAMLMGTAAAAPAAPALPPPVLSFSGPSLVAAEGNAGTTSMVFTVARSGSTTAASTVAWDVAPAGANAALAEDFVGGALPTGVLTFAAGETSKTITVNIAGDTKIEANETFLVNLSNPTGATLGAAIATAGTITNDDALAQPAPVVAFSGPSQVANEGASGATSMVFTVARTGSTSGASTVAWNVTPAGANAAKGEDFVGNHLPSGTVTFAAGETTKTIVVDVAGDTKVEANETFFVTLSSPTGATLGAAINTAGTITNDDVAGGAVAGQLIVSPGPGSVLVGGAGNDTLVASQGQDTLTGGAGADRFTFNSLPWNSGHVTDFTHGSDVIDISALLTAAHYAGSNPVADHYVEFRADGAGNTQVYVDADGPGGDWTTLITTLDHVAPATITASDWFWR